MDDVRTDSAMESTEIATENRKAKRKRGVTCACIFAAENNAFASGMLFGNDDLQRMIVRTLQSNISVTGAVAASLLAVPATNIREKHPRTEGYFDVVDCKNNLDFFRNFRLSRATVDYVHSLVLQDYTKNDDGRGNRPLECKKVLYMTLWYLGNQCTYREISEIFGVSRGFVNKAVHELIDIIYKLSSKFIQWPTVQEAKDDAQEFKKISNFDGVIGAVGGTLIPIKTPVAMETEYLDRKNNHSVHLMALCNSDMKFIFAYAGFPGSATYAKVLRKSGFVKSLRENLEILVPSGDYHVIGDSNFPLTRHFLVPFRNPSNLTRKQKVFNAHLSKTRVVIENAFALLKIRFRRLEFIDASVDIIYKIILSCCVLHNIAMEFPKNEIEIESSPRDLLNIFNNHHDEPTGITYRNYILDTYF